MPLDLEPLELEPVSGKLDLEPLELEPVDNPRGTRRADLQAQQAQAREEGVSTSFSSRLGSGIEQGLRTPEVMVRGGLDALQYYRALDAVTGSGDKYQQQNQAWLKYFNDRDQFLARETLAIEGRDGRNFGGDLVQGVARGVVELPPQLMAGVAGAARGVAVKASSIMGGAQGGITQFAQERGEGRTQFDALPNAVASGLLTAVTTRAFGNTGVEGVFRTEGVQGFRRRLVSVLKDAGMEGAEEMTDQVQQDLLERVARNPGKGLDATLYDVLQAGAVGTAIGGLATAPRLLNRQAPDGPAYVVNSETGTTEFGPVDELPAPLELTPVELPAPVLSEPAPTFNSPATPPMTAAPAATAEAATPANLRSAVSGQRSAAELPEAPGAPEALEGQPFEPGLVVRPEAAMETRRTPELGLQREPIVPPELAEAIAAVRGGYRPEAPALRSLDEAYKLKDELRAVMSAQPGPESVAKVKAQAQSLPAGLRDEVMGDVEHWESVSGQRSAETPTEQRQERIELLRPEDFTQSFQWAHEQGKRRLFLFNPATRVRLEVETQKNGKLTQQPEEVLKAKHRWHVENALRTTQITSTGAVHLPVSAAAVDAYGIKLPAGYVREGDRYVFKTSPPSASAGLGAGAASPEPEAAGPETIAPAGKDVAFPNFKAAFKWALDSVRGVVRNTQTGFDIDISRAGLKKSLSESAVQKSSSKAAHLAAVRSLPDLLAQATLTEQRPARKQTEGISTIYRFTAPLDVEGQPHQVKLTVREHIIPAGKKFYTLETAEIERSAGKSLDATSETQPAKASGGPLEKVVTAPAPVKPAEVRAAEPGEQPQPPAQAAPAMQEGMDNLRFTSEPVKTAKAGGADAKDAKTKLIAELEKAVAQSPFENAAEVIRLIRVVDAPPEVHFTAVNSTNMGAGFEDRYRAEYARAKQLLGRYGRKPKAVTIEIPGDGTFTVANTKEDLGKLLADAKRLETATSSKWAGPRSPRAEVDLQDAAERVYGARRAVVKLREQAANLDLELEEGLREKLLVAAEAIESRLPERVAEAGLARVREQIAEVRDSLANANAERLAHKAAAKEFLDGKRKPRRGKTARSEATDHQIEAGQLDHKISQLNHRLKDLSEREAKTEAELAKALAESQPASARIESAIDAIESAKIKPGGLYSLPDLGLTVTLWNGALNAVQLSLRAGQRLAEAIQSGLDWLRAQGQQFDEAKVRAALEQAILQSPGVREHVGKRLLQEDFSPAAKAAVEKLLLHEVKPDEQLFAEAAAVIEAVGPREALASYFGNPWGLPQDSHVVLGFALGNALSTLETQARAAGDTATANRIGQENAEFQSQFVLQSTETARTLRAYRYFDLVGNLSPFTADVFARKVIEKANAQERQRLKPTLDTVGTELDKVNQQAVNEAAGDKGVQGTARTVINQAIEAEAQQPDSAVRKAIVLEVSNTLETLPSVVRKASEAVVQAWRKLGLEEQVRVQTGRAGQALENSLRSAVKQRGGSASTVASVIAQVNRALHEQVNRTLGVTKEQFTNPATYLMRLRDALGNAEVMSRIWEQTRAAVGANLRAIGEMEGLLLRIEAEIADLEAQAKLPLAGGPEVTATDSKLKAQQQGARDAMLAGRNANLAEAIKQRRERLVDVAAQLEEFRKMKPAWEAVLGMTVDVWGPNLLRGVLREQMKADGFRLRKAVADHFRGLAGAADPLATLGTLTQKIIAASGLDEQAAGRLAKDFEAEYTQQVEKERVRLAERLAKTRERQAARAKQRAIDQPRLDAEALIDGYERRQTEWLKPEGRKSAVRAIVRQALRQGAAVAGLDEQAVRGGLQAHLEAVGVPTEAASRLAYEVWQARLAAGGGVDAVVAGRVKALQLNLGAIVRQHWSQVGRAGESLAAQIVGETKMPAEQAQRLADAIERRFKALATAKKEAILRNLAKTPASRQLQKKSVSQRIIEFSNLGAFDSEGLWNAVAEKLGLASYSREASAEVKRLAERAQQFPEGSVQRQEATARLMRFISRQHGLKLGDLGWAFWYANTLSGPLTQVVNILSNSLSLAGNVATQFRDGRGIPQILAATAKGFRTGAQEARAILRQGPGANRTKFVEQGQALENLDPQDFTGAGLVRQWRIVARALAAADAAFYFPAREAKAITLARALARQEGKTGAAIRQRAREILDGTEQQQNVWGAQVDRERAQLVARGERPDALWTARRLEQLREQAWDSAIGEAADDFALRVTYNNQPYGLIGALADVAKTAQRRVPLARAVVPFVNIVANVTNDSINYTPWGFARAYAGAQTGVPSVTALWADKLRDGQTPLTPDAVIDLHTKAALGTALVGGIMAAALANLDDDDGENFQLYGQGPKDAAARKAWKETGAIPYSVRVNGRFLSIANTPLAIPLGAMGNYLDAARWDKRFDEADMFNRFGVALWGGAHVITQQSFLDAAARLAGALENPRGRSDTLADRGLAEAMRSGGNLVVPNALRQLDRMFDPTIYDNRGIEGALVASIPFARRTGSPALNAFGEPITSSPWARFASDAKPGLWSDLARRGVYPSTAEKVANRYGREMTDAEHYRYVETSGQAIKRRLDTPGMRQKIRTANEKELRQTVTAIVKEERERARGRLGF